jgi:hypothetical protein
MRRLITKKHWENIDDKLFKNGMFYTDRKNWMKARFVVEEDIKSWL